jgi:hypothetical protein
MKPRDAPPAPAAEVMATAADPEDAKAELQRRVDEARESISQTVGEIKETVEDQYTTAKQAITGILDWRDQFQQDPIVWSIGALSAGFALGYTLGAAKRSGALGGKHSAVGAFADTLVRELSSLQRHLPMAALDPTIKRVLGFDLSQLFQEMRPGSPRRKKSPAGKKTVRAKRKKR